MQKLTKGREYIFHKNGPFLKDMYFVQGKGAKVKDSQQRMEIEQAGFFLFWTE